jgi:hypothetical protein
MHIYFYTPSCAAPYDAVLVTNNGSRTTGRGDHGQTREEGFFVEGFAPHGAVPRQLEGRSTAGGNRSRHIKRWIVGFGRIFSLR